MHSGKEDHGTCILGLVKVSQNREVLIHIGMYEPLNTSCTFLYMCVCFSRKTVCAFQLFSKEIYGLNCTEVYCVMRYTVMSLNSELEDTECKLDFIHSREPLSFLNIVI